MPVWFAVVAASPGQPRGSGGEVTRPKGSAGLRSAAVDRIGRLARKSSPKQEELILEVRRTRQLGIKQLRNELLRDHGLPLSLDTLHRVLTKHGEPHLKRPRLARKGAKGYSRPVPGDRVQMDVCKIAPAAYQYTAIDECSRWKVLGVYRRRNAASTLSFLDRLLEEMPFPIQRLQTDRGLEFFAEAGPRRLSRGRRGRAGRIAVS
jgi:hypothetical protein